MQRLSSHLIASKRRIWLLGIILKRWSHRLWISPLVGLMFGLIMVWFLFHANATSVRACGSQQLSQHEPDGHEEYILSRLRSEDAAREVKSALIHDNKLLSMPSWWIQRSVEIKPLKYKWLHYELVYLQISSRHPSGQSADHICDAYVSLAIKYNNERYQLKMEEWILERAALIQSIQKTGGEANTLQAQLTRVESSQDRLKEWQFLMNGGALINFDTHVSSHHSPTITASKILPRWWSDIPLWWKYLMECTVWGLLAGPVAMYLLEVIFPRKLAN